MSSIETAPSSSTEPLTIQTDRSSMVVREITEHDDRPYYELIQEEAAQLERSGLRLPGLYRLIGDVAIRRANPGITMYGIWDNDVLIGGVETVHKVDETSPDTPPAEQEISYFMKQELQGRGLTPTAVNAVLRRGLADGTSFKANAVNQASAKVLRKLHFTPSKNPIADPYYRRKSPIPPLALTKQKRSV